MTHVATIAIYAYSLWKEEVETFTWVFDVFGFVFLIFGVFTFMTNVEDKTLDFLCFAVPAVPTLMILAELTTGDPMTRWRVITIVASIVLTVIAWVLYHLHARGRMLVLSFAGISILAGSIMGGFDYSTALHCPHVC